MTCTHYERETLCVDEMLAFADFGAAEVIKLLEAHPGHRLALVSRGMSGATLATAVALRVRQLVPGEARPVERIHVRKANEDSHGYKVEFSDTKLGLDDKPPVLVFVDDFMETGATLCKVNEALHVECLSSAQYGLFVSNYAEDFEDGFPESEGMIRRIIFKRS